ncbi:MAG: helix-turn-helix transcriptional regulator, partial [Bryobacterales bacterium]|nr:helix-turn-helix transcriptional regulator [Bryobacterales bacterium]
PWQLHRVGNPHVGPSRLHWLILDVAVRRPDQEWKWPSWLLLSQSDLAELTDILRHTEQSVWRASPDLQRCFQGIAQSLQHDAQPSAISSVAVRANELFLLLLELLRRRKPRLDRSLSTASRTVQLFLHDLTRHPELDWTVHAMASACGLGVTQFVHHVKLLANMTPMQYVNRCRLDLAARLLASHPGAHITEVALQCGFASSQYFATVFRRRYGCTPRDYRPS